MTNEELINALRACARGVRRCDECYQDKDRFDCHTDLMRDAAAAIDELQAEVDTLKRTDSKRCQECLYLGQPVGEHLLPHWVSVKERLPEKNGAYLVFIGYGHNWIWFKDIFMDGKFMADTCALNGAKVTHWMPIEPPQEVQDGTE